MIKLAASKLDIDLQPGKIISDFETAALTAAQHVLPSAELQGCHFHFGQCIYRAIQRFGLQTKYAKDVKIALDVRSLIALAFVPEADVGTVYSALIRTGIFESPDENVVQLIDYFEGTWVGKQIRGGEGSQRTEPQYRIGLWNIYKAVMQGGPRTNNAMEGWHNAIKTCIRHGSTVFEFFEFLKKEEAAAALKIRQHYDAGRPNAPKRKCYKDYDTTMKNLVESYETYKSSEKIEYLKNVAKVVYVPN